MDIEEGTFWDEHWVLYGNQFDSKFHILKKNTIILERCKHSVHNKTVVVLFHVISHVVLSTA